MSRSAENISKLMQKIASRKYTRNPKIKKHKGSTLTLAKLAWMSQRPTKKGKESLQILQDALIEQYGPQFEKSIKKAKNKGRKTARRMTVVFSTSLERAYHKYPDSRPYYIHRNWPFTVTTNPLKFRKSSIVVWDSAYHAGFDSHHWAANRELYEIEAKISKIISKTPPNQSFTDNPLYIKLDNKRDELYKKAVKIPS